MTICDGRDGILGRKPDSKNMLKREQKGLMSLLRRHGIDPAKERIHEQEHGER